MWKHIYREYGTVSILTQWIHPRHLILRPQVQIPSTPSLLFQSFVDLFIIKRGYINPVNISPRPLFVAILSDLTSEAKTFFQKISAFETEAQHRNRGPFTCEVFCSKCLRQLCAIFLSIFWCYNFAKYKRISSALFKVGASNRLQKLHVEIACVNRPDVLQNISLLGHEPNPITSNIIGLFFL